MSTAELFLFDVAKKCDELHKTQKLGKPHYKHKFSEVIRRGLSRYTGNIILPQDSLTFLKAETAPGKEPPP